jgi:hypothetical protein
MNEGIEILLARRETHPQEWDNALDRFIPSRWGGILTHYKIELDDPRTYPAGERGERFTNLVMRELLEGESDTDYQRSVEYTVELAKAMRKTKEAMSAHLLRSMYETK